MIVYIIGLLERDLEIYFNYAYPCFQQRNSLVIEISAKGCNDTLAMQYNQGIQKLLNEQSQNIELVVFLHPDVIILDDDFEQKILSAFAENPQVGLVGTLGSTYLPENGAWWSAKSASLRGHIIQEYEDKPTNHMIKGSIGYYDDLLCVDGLFMAIRTSLLNQGLRFDETFPNYHFTDIDICFSVLKLGFKVAVIDTLMLHKSEGKRADDIEWHQNKEILFKKWKQNNSVCDSITLHDLKN
ncbi:MAG TPA: glycosyltransferase [Bacillales bacterium]|nr:glycosyltransferase [Bacillales bacterium]